MRTMAPFNLGFVLVCDASVSSVFVSIAMLVSGALDLASHRPIGLLLLGVSLIWAHLAWYYFRKLIARTENA